MLELYHAINSVCAQKVRIALMEKKLEVKEHLLTLRGDQHEPAYLKINPNGVVPTLIHDGNVITESSVILFYLDDIFPEPPLMPRAPLARARVRLLSKLIDDYIHNACIVLTFAIAFRPGLLKLPKQERELHFSRSPSRQRVAYKRDVIEHGLSSAFVGEALEGFDKLLRSIDDAMASGPYLAGETYSNADIAAIPYISRLELLHLSQLWDKYPGVANWWTRMRERSSTQEAIFARMTEANWAPFRDLSPDPWPKIEQMLEAG